MSKIENDKYYTSSELAKYIVNKTREIIGSENITEYIEPSAGAGVFLDYLDKPYMAYDIEPEDERVNKQDYLSLDLEYKKGRCIIGNPPYGRVNNLATQFYKKSIHLGDYISFILPVSQLNNNIKMYEFDMAYSENLGERVYSGKKVHCCLNIYKRNEGGLNKPPKYNLKDVEIRESVRGTGKRNKIIKQNEFDYDLRICAWGDIGSIVLGEQEYSTEFCIKVHNNKYKDRVLEVIRNANWTEIYPMTTTPKLQLWRVYKYIKEQIPEIQ